jgi:hypothetical protein
MRLQTTSILLAGALALLAILAACGNGSGGSGGSGGSTSSAGGNGGTGGGGGGTAGSGPGAGGCSSSSDLLVCRCQCAGNMVEPFACGPDCTQIEGLPCDPGSGGAGGGAGSAVYAQCEEISSEECGCI